MREIYEQIVKPNITTPTYNDVLTALATHFEPSVNYSYECYVFRRMKQLPDRKIHQYFIYLKNKQQNAILLIQIDNKNSRLNE